MNKQARLIALTVLVLLGAAALAWFWWPQSVPAADRALVDTAAASAREAAAAQPAQPDDPPRQGRARPGGMSGQ